MLITSEYGAKNSGSGISILFPYMTLESPVTDMQFQLMRGKTQGMSEFDADPICGLCMRPIPKDVPQSLHHLIPKLKGGKGGPTVLLHHICHKEIHASLSEAELARDYNTIEALRSHPRLAKFAKWVSKRPASFLSKVPGKRRG